MAILKMNFSNFCASIKKTHDFVTPTFKKSPHGFIYLVDFVVSVYIYACDAAWPLSSSMLSGSGESETGRREKPYRIQCTSEGSTEIMNVEPIHLRI
jgi:hypothetical protein